LCSARKRLRKAVIRDDDDDEDAEPIAAETGTEQPLPASDDTPAPIMTSSAAAAASAPAAAAPAFQAYFKGRATPAPAKPAPDAPAKPAAAAAAQGAAASSAGAGTSKDADASDEDDGHEALSGEEKDKAGKRQLTLFGAGAVAKVAGSAVKGKASLLDLKAYQSYDPEAAATWPKGGDVPFAYLASVFGKIEAESKRLLITQLMANCFRTIIATSPAQLHAAICVATNKIAASYEGLELGVGDAIMIKAVAETCGKSVDAVKAQLEEEGDLGTVAASARRKQITFGKPKPLLVSSVLASFLELARASGKDVMTRKKEKIKQMLVAAQGSEAQYIVRALQGKMRIGLAEQTVLVALAHAVVLTPPPLEGAGGAAEQEPFAPGRPGGPGGTLPKGDALVALLAEAEALVKRVYCEMPNYQVITRVLLTHGLAKLHQHAHLTAGVPVKPMLAKPTKGISEVSSTHPFRAGRKWLTGHGLCCL
jgi:DNA ligase-1